MENTPPLRLRIFIAIFASSLLQEKIAVWIKQFKVDQPATASLIRWLPGENLHLTLVPPWHAEKEEIKALADRLSKGITARPFPLNFKTISFGPTTRTPRLIWATTEESKEFAELQKEVLAIVEEVRTPILKYGELQIHLTLGRFRPEDFKSFPLKQLNATINWQETVREIALVRSETLPTGASYSPLARFPL
jgi:2'-5' RNA ligase